MKQKEINKDENVRLVRILSKDIAGNKKVYPGLTAIRGVSWIYSNAICINLGIDKNKRIEELTEEEIERIETVLSNSSKDFLKFLKNRQKDADTGADKHLVGADWDLQKDFDVKAMKRMKSYKGVRHDLGLPVRGQRTKSHFRKNKSKSGGIKKK